MHDTPERHQRRSLRLKNYDYAQAGAYFVTICTRNRACLFGEIVDGQMCLSPAGCEAGQCWLQIPRHFPNVELDEFVVMPNHVHGILVLSRGTACRAPTVEARRTAMAGACRAPAVEARRTAMAGAGRAPAVERFGQPVSGSLPTVVRSFKSAVTQRINALHGTPGASVWQRNYYEHVIRDEASLQGIREYIANNPLKWALDRENPVHVGARHAVPRRDPTQPWDGL